MNAFMNGGQPPMSTGVANAASEPGGGDDSGRPSVANPGGTANNSYQVVLDSFNKVDAGIRALRSLVLQSVPASGKCANQLDKLAYELGKIKAECERGYAEQQSNDMAQQAAQLMQQY